MEEYDIEELDQQLLMQLCEAMDKLLISVVHLQIQVDDLNEEMKKFNKGD